MGQKGKRTQNHFPWCSRPCFVKVTMAVSPAAPGLQWDLGTLPWRQGSISLLPSIGTGLGMHWPIEFTGMTSRVLYIALTGLAASTSCCLRTLVLRMCPLRSQRPCCEEPKGCGKTLCGRVLAAEFPLDSIISCWPSTSHLGCPAQASPALEGNQTWET